MEKEEMPIDVGLMPRFSPIYYSEFLESKGKKGGFEVQLKLDSYINQKAQKTKKGRRLVAVLVVMSVLLFLVLAFLFFGKNYSLETGENIKDAYVEDGLLHIKMGLEDYTGVESIRLVFEDYSYAEHEYLTYVFDEEYVLSPEDLKLESFSDLERAYAVVNR